MARSMAHELAPRGISEAIALPQERKRKPQKKISRRQFLLGSAALGIGTALTAISGRFLLENTKNVQAETQPVNPPVVETKTNIDILNEINQRYGVEIPTTVSHRYSELDLNTKEMLPNLIPSKEEAEILEKAISKVPGASYLGPLLIPSANTEPDPIPGGSYLGYQWPAFLHPDEFTEFPYDRLVDKRPAISIKIPDVPVDEPLPEVKDKNNLLPSIAAMTNETITINGEEEIPWTTYGDRLEIATIHEFAHGIEDQLSLATSSSVSEYWNKQAFTIVNKNTWDIDNPVFTTFAKVNGWELIPEYDYVKQYDSEFAEYLKDGGWAKGFLWDRDPKVWGDLKDRKLRLTVYASYGPIQEAFAEFWMASILYPELLTEDEKAYFGKLHNGLRGNPEEFIKQIATNPNILLSQDNLTSE